ncbi:MAG: 2-succinyl-5-enolpyruvyl-6-hydroxy-3-cyclohexene-1-carboxylic-acid synthase [Solirubrobacteraceae bacterium]
MTPAVDTHLLLRAFCDELARCGLTDACTSPGSRSAPLVLALVREERIRCWSHIDERCAGFFALGLAKATGRPAVIACTSGTAAANFAPAVHEAHEGHVPLVVLTADRPPELRDIGAGQTIDQVKLYGSAAKWFFEVGNHEATEDRLRWIRQLACRAYATSLDGRPGAVHLNFPLREPLVLDEELPPDESGRPDERPWVTLCAATHTPGSAAALSDLATKERGVVIAGRTDDPKAGRAAARFAEHAGWPVLGDPLSGARTGASAIAHYDALLRGATFASANDPEVVVRVGDLPTSKPLRQWLTAAPGARHVALDPAGAWQDPSSSVEEILGGDPVEALTSAIEETPSRQRISPWLTGWLAADRETAEAISATLSDELSEPSVAATIGRVLPPDATLWVASSMPVRDVETFFPARDAPPRVLSNRGANGIDGTVSSAFGVAATGARTVLLIGDVALAHDLGGLLAAGRLGLSLTIVLLNNDGGGIFHFLPLVSASDVFEHHVATPHGLDFAAAAQLYGIEHRRIDDLEALRIALEEPASKGTRILEVRTDREANVALHRRVWDAVTARGSGAAPPA